MVLLVSDPSKDLDEVGQKEGLKSSEEELNAMAKECGDFNMRKLNIETKLHKDIRGQNDTTLNALVLLFFRVPIWSVYRLQPDDRTVSIKFSENAITIRGISSDVERTAKEIQRIADSAAAGKIEYNFVSSNRKSWRHPDPSQDTEFEIAREFVKHLVGASGATANKLREQLGVKVDFVDDAEDKDAKRVKKATESGQKTLVKVGQTLHQKCLANNQLD
jgi:hypothetical protein